MARADGCWSELDLKEAVHRQLEVLAAAVSAGVVQQWLPRVLPGPIRPLSGCVPGISGSEDPADASAGDSRTESHTGDRVAADRVFPRVVRLTQVGEWTEQDDAGRVLRHHTVPKCEERRADTGGVQGQGRPGDRHDRLLRGNRVDADAVLAETRDARHELELSLAPDAGT